MRFYDDFEDLSIPDVLPFQILEIRDMHAGKIQSECISGGMFARSDQILCVFNKINHFHEILYHGILVKGSVLIRLQYDKRQSHSLTHRTGNPNALLSYETNRPALKKKRK